MTTSAAVTRQVRRRSLHQEGKLQSPLSDRALCGAPAGNLGPQRALPRAGPPVARTPPSRPSGPRGPCLPVTVGTVAAWPRVPNAPGSSPSQGLPRPDTQWGVPEAAMHPGGPTLSYFLQ